MNNRFLKKTSDLKTKSKSSSTTGKGKIIKHNKMTKKQRRELFLKIVEIARLLATLIGWFL